MNRFDMLKQVREDINRGRGLANRFCLSAVIVHDTADKELKTRLKKNFEKWAKMTGENFLFITFITPSEKWKTSHYADDKYCVDKNYLMTEWDAKKEDEETTIELLRNFMGLPKRGSYMMLTENLGANCFYRIPVTAEAIEEQLGLITSYCEQDVSGGIHGPGDMKVLVDRLKAEVHNNTRPMVEVLTDVTSISSRVLTEYNKDEQRAHSESVIKELKGQLGNIEDDGYEERLILMYEVIRIAHKNWRVKRQPSLRSECSSISPSLGYIQVSRYEDNAYISLDCIQLNTPESDAYEPVNRSPFPSREDSRKLLDDYSKYLLRSHDQLKKFVDTDPDIDYSGLTIYLGKIVEYETNLSIGQLLRYVMDIDMPEYYNLYCAGKKVSIPAGNRNWVNMNQYVDSPDDYSPLRCVPLGHLAHAYRIMSADEEDYPDVPNWGRFIELDNDLIAFLISYSANYRNLAAHIDHDSRFTYINAKRAFDEFMEYYLPQLYDVKQHLQGVGGLEYRKL